MLVEFSSRMGGSGCLCIGCKRDATRGSRMLNLESAEKRAVDGKC
jgi:hypothetical protein